MHHEFISRNFAWYDFKEEKKSLLDCDCEFDEDQGYTDRQIIVFVQHILVFPWIPDEDNGNDLDTLSIKTSHVSVVN